MANTRKEYTFKLYPSKAKSFARSHWCDNDNDAIQQLYGMMYAMYFEHRHPHAELWREGKMIKSIR